MPKPRVNMNRNGKRYQNINANPNINTNQNINAILTQFGPIIHLGQVLETEFDEHLEDYRERGFFCNPEAYKNLEKQQEELYKETILRLRSLVASLADESSEKKKEVRNSLREIVRNFHENVTSRGKYLVQNTILNSKYVTTYTVKKKDEAEMREIWKQEIPLLSIQPPSDLSEVPEFAEKMWKEGMWGGNIHFRAFSALVIGIKTLCSEPTLEDGKKKHLITSLRSSNTSTSTLSKNLPRVLFCCLSKEQQKLLQVEENAQRAPWESIYLASDNFLRTNLNRNPNMVLEEVVNKLRKSRSSLHGEDKRDFRLAHYGLTGALARYDPARYEPKTLPERPFTTLLDNQPYIFSKERITKRYEI